MSTRAVPTIAAGDLPWLSVAQMIEVDRIMIEDLGITLARMMENAGRGLAELTRRLAGGTDGLSVAVLAGGGGNGGGGMVAARHLINAGARVVVHPAVDRPRMSPVAAQQAQILMTMGASFADPTSEPLAADWVLDALLGYSGRGAPRGTVADLIRSAKGRRVIALDVPSGLDLGSGELHEPHLCAEATLTLAAPKEGLVAAARATGPLWLADISVPAVVWTRIGVPPVPAFRAGPVVPIRSAGRPGSSEGRQGAIPSSADCSM